MKQVGSDVLPPRDQWIRWKEALLECFVKLGGVASLQDLYIKVREIKFLDEMQLRETEWEGRPAYQHEVRSFISGMHKSGDVRRLERGRYEIMPQGLRAVGVSTTA